MGAGDDHRGDLSGIVRALVVVDRDEAIHEGPRGHHRHLAQLPGADLFFRYQPPAPEALRVSDDRIDPRLLDRGEHVRGLGEVGSERFLDQHGQLALQRRHDRIDVQVLVGRNHRGGHFGPLEEFVEVGGDEIRADLLGHELCALRVLLRDADPIDLGVASGEFTANQADASRADDRKSDAFGLFLHIETLDPLIVSGYQCAANAPSPWPTFGIRAAAATRARGVRPKDRRRCRLP